jgi:hypothetical protein
MASSDPIQGAFSDDHQAFTWWPEGCSVGFTLPNWRSRHEVGALEILQMAQHFRDFLRPPWRANPRIHSCSLGSSKQMFSQSCSTVTYIAPSKNWALQTGGWSTHQDVQTAPEQCDPHWLWSQSHAGPSGWWHSVEQDLVGVRDRSGLG